MKHIKILLIAFAVISLRITSAQAAEHPRYNIEATVDTQKKTLAAVEEVVFTNNSDQSLNEIYFHIYPNRKYSVIEKNFMLRYASYFKVNPFPGGYHNNHFQIQAVTKDNQSLSFAIEGDDETILRVALDKKLSPGESVTLILNFSTDIPYAYGRFGWVDGVLKFSHWYPILSVYDKKGWHNYPFYPFHRPFFSEASDYNVALTVPQNQVVIHTGSLASENRNSDGTKTLSLATSRPVRDFTFAMSKDYQVKEDSFGGVKIKSFYLPGDEQGAVKAIGDVKSLMEFYTKFFGKYPYPEFSIAPVPLGNGGEQMSNMIFIDNRVYKMPGVLDRYFDFLVAHETGHQWIYNLVGVDEYQEMWLEEGLNSYFIQEYIRNKYGKNAEILNYPDWFKNVEWLLPDLTFEKTRDFRYKMITRIGFDHPVVSNLPSFAEPSSIFALAYGKGSAIFAMLKNLVGEEKFNKIFARIFREYQYQNLSIAEFIRISQEESGKDLSAFFDQWLYSDKNLDYAITKVKGDAAGVEVTVEQRGGVKMPVQMKVGYANGTATTYDLDMQQRTEVFPFAGVAGSKVKYLKLDPNEKLLDIDRTNDRWPRRLKFMFVPLYLPLHDIPLFLPEDSYNVVIGPEISRGVGLKASFQKPFDYIFYGGTDYEFGEQLHHSRIGYQLNNVLHKQMAAGVEITNTKDYDDGADDLASGKIFLRRELWPAQYGLGDINDHISLYLLRNRSINDGAQIISGREDGSNIDYSRRNESIVGTTLSLNRSGPYPDPVQGYKVNTMVESAGHFWGATQYFFREAIDLSAYYPVTPLSKVAARVKAGAGHPDDKALFFIGGMDGLRGYDRKTVRGANALLGSLEYRFPIKDGLKIYFLDNIFGIESIGGVVFADAGQSWFGDFDGSKLRKDAGAGLRLTVNLAGLLEKVIVRLDVARAINDPEEDDTRFWFGINHAF